MHVNQTFTGAAIGIGGEPERLAAGESGYDRHGFFARHVLPRQHEAAEDRQGLDGPGRTRHRLPGNAYSLFQTATVLEDKVRERTRRLETALRELEKSNRELSIAKEQTETAQTRLMEAVESISEGFVHFDADDRLVLCNTKFLEFWSDGKRDIREVLRPGVSFREISRWTVETGLIVDVDGDPDEWLRGRLYRHSNPSDPHVVHLASGRWLQIRERQRDGGTVGIYTDITAIKLDEQQRREQELAEKSILLQSTLDNLAQGVSVFDKHLGLLPGTNVSSSFGTSGLARTAGCVLPGLPALSLGARRLRRRRRNGDRHPNAARPRT